MAGTYGCPVCKTRFDHAPLLNKCPKCGNIPAGIRCAKCGHVGQRDEFENNANCCPECGHGSK